jgi:hypothetical protein
MCVRTKNTALLFLGRHCCLQFQPPAIILQLRIHSWCGFRLLWIMFLNPDAEPLVTLGTSFTLTSHAITNFLSGNITGRAF